MTWAAIVLALRGALVTALHWRWVLRLTPASVKFARRAIEMLSGESEPGTPEQKLAATIQDRISGMSTPHEGVRCDGSGVRPLRYYETGEQDTPCPGCSVCRPCRTCLYPFWLEHRDGTKTLHETPDCPDCNGSGIAKSLGDRNDGSVDD